MPRLPRRQRILWPPSPEYISVQESGQLSRFWAMTLAPSAVSHEAINVDWSPLLGCRRIVPLRQFPPPFGQDMFSLLKSIRFAPIGALGPREAERSHCQATPLACNCLARRPSCRGQQDWRRTRTAMTLNSAGLRF